MTWHDAYYNFGANQTVPLAICLPAYLSSILLNMTPIIPLAIDMTLLSLIEAKNILLHYTAARRQSYKAHKRGATCFFLSKISLERGVLDCQFLNIGESDRMDENRGGKKENGKYWAQYCYILVFGTEIVIELY